MIKACIVYGKSEKKIWCMFNPKEYSDARQNKWTEKTAKGKNVPHLEFTGGQPGNLKLQLLFDTSEDHDFGNIKVRAGEDVTKYTNGLLELIKVDEQNKNPSTGKGEPPHCYFLWGSLRSFEGVIESIAQKFVLFKADGTPLRAIVDISLHQVTEENMPAKQNPTSGGGPASRLRVLHGHERLSLIAFEEYGETRHWRYLADANQIRDPLSLRAGQVLIIPPLPME
jgi:hypothetical protein